VNIIPDYDSFALAAPQSFRDGIQAAINILDETFTANITVKIAVGYGEFNGTSLPSQNVSEGGFGNGQFLSYSTLRADLIAASDLDANSTSLLNAASVNGVSSFLASGAQLRLFGVLPAVNNTNTDDGIIGMGTNFTGAVLVSGALHEITHALGRVNGTSVVLDIFRFTSIGNRLFTGGSTSAPAYFSLDNGVTDIADFGQTSDPGDFLNNFRTTNDPFNEFVGNLGALTASDVKIMDALGFRRANANNEKYDFNADGASDILWRNSNGSLADWTMNGNVISGAFVTSNGSLVAPDASWSVAGISDFNADHQADVLWRNSSGLLATWLMNGSTISGSGYMNVNGAFVTPDPSWNIAGIGDLNGDGKSDLLWRDSQGSTAVWVMDGASIVGSGYLNVSNTIIAPDPSWSVVGMGDFNGDKYADLLWRNSVTGELAEWQLHSSDIIGSNDVNNGSVGLRPDASWTIAGIGDFNADGDADILWRNSNGTVSAWLLHGSTVIDGSALTFHGAAVNVAANWQVVQIGDFNGDGSSDILWRDSGTGQLSEWLMTGNVVSSQTTLSSNGAAVNPDLSWNVQAKPTNFA
jgi:hypothetical protein